MINTKQCTQKQNLKISDKIPYFCIHITQSIDWIVLIVKFISKFLKF